MPGVEDENAQRLRAVFENVALGIAEVDTDARLENVNQRLCDLLGYSRSELIGRSIHDLTAPEDRDRSLDLNGRLLRGELPGFDYEKRYVRRDGSRVWVHVTVSPVRGPGGRVLRAVGTIEDIDDRKLAEEALRRSERQYRTLAENAPEVIARFDRELRHTYVNEYGARVYGLDRAHVIGKTNAELGMPADKVAFWREHLLQVLATGRQETVDFDFDSPAYGHQYFSSLFVPERDDAGAIVSILAITRDVTSLRRIEQALRGSERRLEEADRRKTEFLAVLSHELRNPLAPIASSLYVLERAAPGGLQARHAREVIARQVGHMTRLVDDLLDVTRIARGKVRLQRERVELCELVTRAAEDNRSIFNAAQVRLETVTCASPLHASVDPTRLAQVIGNLLSNAVKFTPPGGRVRLSLASEDGMASIRVRDDGAGLDPDLVPKLFEPFVQADATLDRSKGGLGLGLALVKGLVELHGGDVAVRSEGPGQGAEFVVRVPLEPAQEPAAGERARIAAAPGRRLRVLVIEDNADGAETLKEALELNGHVVETSATGLDGIERARAFRPEVVLCDIGLPGIDGFEVARRFRRDPELRGTCLVALSGYASPDDLERSRAAGFERHLPKPPDIDELLATLSDACGPRPS